MTTEFGSTLSSLRIGPKSVDLRAGKLPIIMKFRKGVQKKAKEQTDKEKKEKKEDEREDVH
jgi:hypothetical protein